ncbi:glycosyltransferase [Conexibacter woesei]|uniref:glycosyltransferase n=1 Tax=Conexibacter woesei TaxID=191495 RepID=UPI000428867C|nr:glycosyltransferase [Conexibacter woesei]
MHRPDGRAPAAIGVAVIDADRPLEHFDFTTAERWNVLVLAGGVPVARVELASPGATSGPELARAAILRHADRALERRRLDASLRERLGVKPPRPAPVTVTVVVCTHGRPAHLPNALAGIAALDPAPADVVIVDNAPGANDCRALVEGHGFRYVREDAKGLDNARNAGLRAARGQVIAFMDDDVIPSPQWLAGVDALFADPLVACVTGPAFPYTLADPAQARMERQASLTRGLERRRWDWTVLSPVHGGQVGVGANMLLRASAVAELGEVLFPPELDAGTATESGGDTYAFGRLLAAGRRLVYDPATFVFHVHRAEADALERAVRGYGTGMAASLLKNLLEHGELEVPRAGFWFVRQLFDTTKRYMLGRGDELELRIAWLYLRGAFDGPARLLRAKRAAPSAGPIVPPGAIAAAAPVATPAAAAAAPRLTVVVPTVGRREALARNLAALAGQDAPAGSFAVLVVDDAPGAPTDVAALAPAGMHLAVLRTAGAGAAKARNAGARAADTELVLFVDDDVVPEPGLVAGHLAAHDAGAPDVVFGPYPPRLRERTLAASGAEPWWVDHTDEIMRTGHLRFTDVLSGNTSVRRERFVARGGFPEAMATWRREDWAWGLQLQEEGAVLAVAPGARAWHEYRLSAVQRLNAAYGEGRGDALLTARWPAAVAGLDAHKTRLPDARRRPLRLATTAALASARGRAATGALLAVLEAAHLRQSWSVLHRRAQRAAYATGLRHGGFPGVQGALADVVGTVEVDLLAGAPIPVPDVPGAPLARVRAGALTQDVVPPEGHWGDMLVKEIGDHLEWPLWRAALPRPPQAAPPADPARVAFVTASPVAAAAARAAGLRVVETADAWAAAAALLDAGDEELVGVLLGDVTPTRAWLDATLLAFDGDRVAAVVGEALEPEDPEPPIGLHDRDPRRLPFLRVDTRFAYIILRAETARAAGGIRPAQQRLGAAAPLLWTLERLLHDGHVIAERAAPELGAGTATGALRPGLDAGATRRTGLRLAAGQARAEGGGAGALLALRAAVTGANATRMSLKRRLRSARG